MNQGGQFIFDYLQSNGGIYSGDIVVLKRRKISNFYIDARILNAQNADGSYKHDKFLQEVGSSIGFQARCLGATMLVGVVTTGATLAQFAGEVSGMDYCFWDPHNKDNPVPDGDVIGQKVLVIDDTTTTGKSIADAVAVCSAIGAEVVGALTLVRRDPKKVREEEVGLDQSPSQKFISLLDIETEIIVEDGEISIEERGNVDEDTLVTPAGNVIVMGTLVRSGRSVRLDVGYAATDRWPEKFAWLTYVGKPTYKE